MLTRILITYVNNLEIKFYQLLNINLKTNYQLKKRTKFNNHRKMKNILKKFKNSKRKSFKTYNQNLIKQLQKKNTYYLLKFK